MATPIKTFIFLDSETTGLPSMENNRTRMTELCFTAVQSDHIQLGTFPRIQNKITLCFNPGKFIDPQATAVSGLSNELLEYQSSFSTTAFGIIENFLSMQRDPICFVAHNGNRFDFPILRAEIHKTGNELKPEILCVDSLETFRQLYQEDQLNTSVIKQPEVVEVPIEFQDGYDELLCNLVDDLEQSSSKKLTMEEIQMANETTPQKQIIVQSKCRSAPARRILPFERPSFRLGEVYKRLTEKEPTDAHKAEYDVSMLIECAAALGDRFVDWSNFHAKRFCDIPMMTPGKSIGK